MLAAPRNFHILIFFSLMFLCAVKSPYVQAQPMAAQETADGSELFIQYRCSACHTIGRGVFVGPDLSGVGDRYSREDIIRWIENPQLIYNETGKMPLNPGFPPMPPMQVPPEAAAAITEYILSAEPDSEDSEGGTIAGRMISGSDLNPKSGVEITLTPFMGERPSGEPKTVVSADDGAFSFTQLPWDRSYSITINYKGTELYSTDRMVFNPGEDEKTLELPVFEPTESDETILISDHQILLQVLDGKLEIAEIIGFENRSDKIYIGGQDLGEGKKETLRFAIPKQASNFEFFHGLDPQSLITSNIGFSDTGSILPGPKRVVFTYELPLDSGSASLEKEILYPTSRLLLLIPEAEEKFRVKGLTQEEPVDSHNETYLKWSGTDLASGSSVLIEVGSGSIIGSDYTTWAALGILLIIVAFGVVYAAAIKKRPKDYMSVEEPKTTRIEDRRSLEERRSSFIKEIAALDDKYEAGGIAEGEYKALRESKKKEILDITKRLRSSQ